MRAEGVSSVDCALGPTQQVTAERDSDSLLQNAAEEMAELPSYSGALDQTILLKLNVSAPSETNSSHFLQDSVQALISSTLKATLSR